jgi:hypothetical protein
MSSSVMTNSYTACFYLPSGEEKLEMRNEKLEMN